MKIVEIKVIIAVKLLGMLVRFFQVAINRKTLSKIIIRKNDKNAERSLIINHKSISSAPPRRPLTQSFGPIEAHSLSRKCAHLKIDRCGKLVNKKSLGRCFFLPINFFFFLPNSIYDGNQNRKGYKHKESI